MIDHLAAAAGPHFARLASRSSSRLPAGRACCAPCPDVLRGRRCCSTGMPTRSSTDRGGRATRTAPSATATGSTGSARRDMKGGVAAIVCATVALAAAGGPAAGTLVLAVTADEDAGMRWGVPWLAGHGRLGADAAIVAEAAGVDRRLRPAGARLPRLRLRRDRGRDAGAGARVAVRPRRATRGRRRRRTDRRAGARVSPLAGGSRALPGGPDRRRRLRDRRRRGARPPTRARPLLGRCPAVARRRPDHA